MQVAQAAALVVPAAQQVAEPVAADEQVVALAPAGKPVAVPALRDAEHAASAAQADAARPVDAAAQTHKAVGTGVAATDE